MNPRFTAFQLPVAAATERFVVAPLAAVSVARSLFRVPASAEATQQAHKARNLASLTAHRAQMLTQRRTVIHSSAKRW